MKKLSIYAKHTALTGAFFVFAVTFLLGSTPKALALSDNTWWGKCSGRFTVGSVYFGGSRVTAYGCSNGYFFTNTGSSRYGQVFASITRVTPYYTNLISRTYGYGATTNMVSKVNGATYEVFGYTPDGSKSFRFTW